jgi:hypothetical protein
MVYMRQGEHRALDFESNEAARTALQEVNHALQSAAMRDRPLTIADRLVVIPRDVRWAEVTTGPSE